MFSIEDEKKRILLNLKEDGIAISHAQYFFNPQDMLLFEEAQKFFEAMLADEAIIERRHRIKNKALPSDKKNGKPFEITHHHYLHRGLTLQDNNLIQLNLASSFLDIAHQYLGEEPKVRNVLGWLMTEYPYPPTHSQTWHRDTEGERVLKVWIYFSDVTEKNGAANYVKQSCKGKRNDHIWYNLINEKRNWPGQSGYLSAAAASNIPLHEVVTATGKVGTIVFADTNGFHRGGYVREGYRTSTHTVYLRSDAREIVEGPLTHFNYNPEVNYCDYNSPEYAQLSSRQKKCLA